MSVLVALVLTLGAIAGAVATVGALAAAVGRFVSKRRARHRDELVATLTAVIDNRLTAVEARFAERLDRVEYELNPNGGGSMRDAVRRIETKVGAIGTFLRAQATALGQDGVNAPDPRDFNL